MLETFKNTYKVKLFFTLCYMSDNKLFNLSPDLDTYIYVLFLRSSLNFFLCLALINGVFLIPMYLTGVINSSYYETILPHLQKLTIANIISDQPRLYVAFGMNCFSFLLLCIFILHFKRKVDYIMTNYTQNKYDEEDVILSE